MSQNNIARRADLVALINTYNEARTRHRAAESEPGVDYRELSNGALWPVREA